jgi:phosphoribosylanthranilate isomerase
MRASGLLCIYVEIYIDLNLLDFKVVKMSKVKVKICCISSIKEAQIAINHGASALGLVGDMPSGPGIISDDLIAQISKTVPPPISTFLLTSETNADAIINHYKK